MDSECQFCLFDFDRDKKNGCGRYRESKLHSVSSLLLPFTLLCFNIEPTGQSKVLSQTTSSHAHDPTQARPETELTGRFERLRPTLSAAGFGDFPQSFKEEYRRHQEVHTTPYVAQR